MMRDVTGRVLKLVHAVVLLSFSLHCVGCSLASEQLPPSDPSLRTKRAARHCSDVLYPLVDTFSTAASISWVFLANGKIEDNQPKPEGYRTENGVTAYYEAQPGDRSAVSGYEVLRGVAYGSAALFALSAIYGWVVEGQCATLRREVGSDGPTVSTAASSPSSPSSVSVKRSPFPRSVLDFDFQYRPEQAAQLCSSRGGTWSFDENVALCSWPGNAAKPSVQLAFELGVPSRISVIYEASPAKLPATYATLAASMRKFYGAPQVDAAPPSSTCATALASCLEHGEHVVGPVWRWASGTIELNPIWQEDRAVLELRYVREASGAP